MENSPGSTSVDACHTSNQEGEGIWENLCNEHGWNDETQIILLEGFLRDRGLFGIFAEQAQKVAEEEALDSETLSGSSGGNLAFQVTVEDIENVLQSYSIRVINTRGLSILDMAEELITQIDCDRVEGAALRSGCDLDDQTNGAYEEIHKILVEMGVIEF